MIKTETVVRVHKGNLLVNRKAKKLALLNILKTDYEHGSV